MKDVIRFDVLYGRCAHCGGPVYFTQTIDWEGNRINSFQCWNGHYEKIEVDHPVLVNPKSMTREEIEGILPFVGFIRLDEPANG